MSGKLILYPSRKVSGQKFKGCKVYTLPSQAMTLQEILRRFVRNESLPIAREGVYEDRFGDLEKLKTKDITEQMEVVEIVKAGKKARASKKPDAPADVEPQKVPMPADQPPPDPK